MFSLCVYFDLYAILTFRRADARPDARRRLRVAIRDATGGDVTRLAAVQLDERDQHLQLVEVGRLRARERDQHVNPCRQLRQEESRQRQYVEE